MTSKTDKIELYTQSERVPAHLHQQWNTDKISLINDASKI